MPLLVVDLTNASSNVQSFVANVNWAQPSWDLFIVLFFIIAGFLYGLSLGRDRVIVILVSIYMALAVVNTAPYIGNLQADVGLASVFVFRISAFVALFIALFLLLARSALLQTIANADSKGSWWQVMVFSFLHVGLLISIVLSFLPASASNHLAPVTRSFFVSETARFLWIIGPILAMIMIKGGAAERKKFKYDI
ncbi:MAG: hypothetical protein HY420_04815 [Candidatus Kerfeldbacteria bacterium]|nr:hypothetical protein [Candidatus Kerfeldbacteria bacterium]